MIEKMEFLSISGPQDEIDRIAGQYFSKYEIHLENALSELSTVHDLKAFVAINPYKEILARSNALISMIAPETNASNQTISLEDAITLINKISVDLDLLAEKKEALIKKINHFKDLSKQIKPFRMLNYDIKKILDFKFIKFRFGRIQHRYFQKVTNYIYANLNTVFYQCDTDGDYVWGVYFVPASSAATVDAAFSSLHFERCFIADEYDGTPEEAYQSTQKKLADVKLEIKQISKEIKAIVENHAAKLLSAHALIVQTDKAFDIRKYAACTHSEHHSISFILCGWMSKSDAKAFMTEIEQDPEIFCIEEDSHDCISKPPTKLRNPKLAKPFEMFINMYGLPAYNEIDPTIFVALTYTLMFGIMFGDVGQGLALVIGGTLLYKLKKMNIAGIISLAGIWSTLFGFMYGSIFGFEDVLTPLWRSPMDDIMFTLTLAIGFGMVLILIAMLFHVINAIKAKEAGSLLFDSSGIAGIICYGSVVASLALMLTRHPLPGTVLLSIIVGLPLLAIFLKEPLTHIIEKEGKVFPTGSKAMFFVEAFVELFDVVLSYATNTISFVRVGAFALSHAGMMGVVLTLSNVANGHPNLVILILGNILVTGLEGLVVGIQVLRLEYYEMFSRFYRGTGKPFAPFQVKL